VHLTFIRLKKKEEGGEEEEGELLGSIKFIIGRKEHLPS